MRVVLREERNWPTKPRRMPGDAFGQGRLFQQNDVFLTGFCEMIGNRAADDATSDDEIFALGAIRHTPGSQNKNLKTLPEKPH